MKRSYEKVRAGISIDGEISKLPELFDTVKDNRGKNSRHKLSDILMSGYVMFSLKYPSLSANLGLKIFIYVFEHFEHNMPQNVKYSAFCLEKVTKSKVYIKPLQSFYKKLLLLSTRVTLKTLFYIIFYKNTLFETYLFHHIQ